MNSILTMGLLLAAMTSAAGEAERRAFAENFNANAEAAMGEFATHYDSWADGTTFRVTTPVTVWSFDSVLDDETTLPGLCAEHLADWGESALSAMRSVGFERIAFEAPDHEGYVCDL